MYLSAFALLLQTYWNTYKGITCSRSPFKVRVLMKCNLGYMFLHVVQTTTPWSECRFFSVELSHNYHCSLGISRNARTIPRVKLNSSRPSLTSGAVDRPSFSEANTGSVTFVNLRYPTKCSPSKKNAVLTVCINLWPI